MSAEVKQERESELERQSKELNDFVLSLPASTSDRAELVPEEIDALLPSDMPALPALPNPKVADDGDSDEGEDEKEDDNDEDESDGSKESEDKDKAAMKFDGDIYDRKEGNVEDGNEAGKDALLSVDYNYYANQGWRDADPAQKPILTTPAKRRASITDEKSFSEIMSEAEEAVSKTSMLPFTAQSLMEN